MKKLFYIVLLIAICLTFAACSGQTEASEPALSRETFAVSTEIQKPNYPTEFSIGDALLYPGMYEVTMNSMEFTKKVEPPKPKNYYSYYEVKESGNIYVHSIFKVKNLKGSSLSAEDILDVKVLYDEKYEYNSFSTIEEDGGPDFTYTNITGIDPLTYGVLHFITEVPVEVKDSGKSVKIIITIGDITMICNGETDAPETIQIGDNKLVLENTSWEKFTKLSLNNLVTEVDYAEMTIKKAEFNSTVKPTKASGYYSYYEVKDNANTYAHLIIDFKNLKTTGTNADEIASVRVVYDNKYEYRGFSAIEEDGGSDLTYTNIIRIDPLTVGTIHYIFEVPKEVKDSGLPVVFVISLNKTNYYYQLVE